MKLNAEHHDRIGWQGNNAKYELMQLEDYLRSEGAEKQADQLSKIIIRLETWQNTVK